MLLFIFWIFSVFNWSFSLVRFFFMLWVICLVKCRWFLLICLGVINVTILCKLFFSVLWAIWLIFLWLWFRNCLMVLFIKLGLFEILMLVMVWMWSGMLFLEYVLLYFIGIGIMVMFIVLMVLRMGIWIVWFLNRIW